MIDDLIQTAFIAFLATWVVLLLAATLFRRLFQWASTEDAPGWKQAVFVGVVWLVIAIYTYWLLNRV